MEKKIEIKTKHKKTLICIADIANKGKTETANNVKDLLMGFRGANMIYQNKQNTSFVIEINSQKIGVDNKGDPKTGFPQRIDYLGNYPCDAIVCTSRSSGETFEAAKNTARRYSLLFIKTTTYQPDDPIIENILNDYRAKELIDLLKSRGHL
jgi:hypothetical protein